MKLLIEKYNQLTKNFENFHQFQEDAINALLQGKNSLVIAPTGKGKSLIYQIAGQELPGITIVVSPLIALINEQADFLGGDLALSLSSNISFAEQRKVLRDIANGSYSPKFIFLSPERIQNYFFKSALKASGLAVSLFVVDEAHCISQWGSDFRPEYDQITQFITFLKELNQNPAILAMTATIGEKPKTEILAEFKINSEQSFYDRNLLRPELELNFIEVSEEKEKFHVLEELLKEHKPKKALVYFYDIPNCRSFAKRLNKLGHSSLTYYSGMQSQDKEAVYSKFRVGEIDILCATTAFGMGMNIPDIDMVVHHRMPNSIEEYYQQAGRAARDKKVCPSAKCFLLWSEANFEFKFDEHIPSTIIQMEQIENAFRQFGLTNNANIPQSLEYSDYISQELGRLRYCFEKRGLLKTIGEVNGTPKSIEFVNKNAFWDAIVTKMSFGNSFIRAAQNSGLELHELIDFVFERELNGEIKKFPAREKKIFLISQYNQIPIDLLYEIIDESINLADFKEEQVHKLIGLIKSDDPQNYIKSYFKNN